MMGDLMDGCDIWVESSDPYPLLFYVVAVGHVLAWPTRIIVAVTARVSWGQVVADAIGRVQWWAI